MKHSHIGASSCERFWNCPGSVELIKLYYPEQQPPSIYAAEGIVSHALGEERLKNEKPFTKVSYEHESESIMCGDHEIEITEEMIDAVDLYCQTIWQDQKGMDDAILRIEQGFHLKHIDEEAYGTNDASLEQPFVLLRIYDFKYGAGKIVNVKNNKQMMYYGLGAAYKKVLPEVELVIIQPRAGHIDGAVRRYRLSAEELNSFGEELKEKIEETRNPKAIFQAGDHCKFCPGAPQCKGLLNKVQEVAKIDFAKVPSVIPPDPSTLSIFDIQKVLEFSSIIEDWLKRVQEHAHVILEHGEEIEGFKLVQKRSNAKYKDVDAIAEEFGDMLGDKLWNKKMIGVVELRKLIGKKKVEELTFKPDSGTTIAPEHDKRPAIAGSVKEDFKDV